jgi:hypothetical protein
MYRKGEQQDVTETLRFFFDLFGGSDKPLIRTVFTGEQDERMSGRSTFISFSFKHFYRFLSFSPSNHYHETVEHRQRGRVV